VRIGGNDNQQPTHAEWQIVADYAQFHLFDQQAAPEDVPDDWGTQLVENKIAAHPDEPSLLGLATARSAKLPITIDVLDHAPGTDDVPDWDYVVETTIETPSGVLLLNGPTALRNKAGEIRVTPGTYRVRHHSAELDTISEDALDGNDHYQILLWQEPYREPQTLKI
jgi:hypothetical protein